MKANAPEQYIDKDALVAEIYKLKKSHDNWSCMGKCFHRDYETLLSFIDTLEVKEVDLNDKIYDYINAHYSEGCDGGMISDANKSLGGVMYSDLTTIAKHFFELGLKAQKGEDSVNDGLKEIQKNIWHSLDEKPSFPISDDELLCSILVLYNNGNMFLYRYGKNGIPNDLLTPHFRNIMNAKWCYCKDVINK